MAAQPQLAAATVFLPPQVHMCECGELRVKSTVCRVKKTKANIPLFSQKEGWEMGGHLIHIFITYYTLLNCIYIKQDWDQHQCFRRKDLIRSWRVFVLTPQVRWRKGGGGDSLALGMLNSLASFWRIIKSPFPILSSLSITAWSFRPLSTPASTCRPLQEGGVCERSPTSLCKQSAERATF